MNLSLSLGKRLVATYWIGGTLALLDVIEKYSPQVDHSRTMLKWNKYERREASS